MENNCFDYSYLGFGLGLRAMHYKELSKPNLSQDVDWLEIISENYFHPGGRHQYFLDLLKERYPMVMHGVSMNLGSIDPIDYTYLDKLKKLIAKVQPKWISDHLCWTGINKVNTHDLLPLPYTEEVVEHVCTKIIKVQDYLETKILLENPSSYLTFAESTLTEWEVMKNIAEQADCLLLLDVNNIYVSSKNHNFSAIEYLNNIPINRVQQIHLAGHTHYPKDEQFPEHIIDTHDNKIVTDVWDLYAKAIKRFGKVSTMIERDQNIPKLSELLLELKYAKEVFANSNIIVEEQELVPLAD